MNTLPMATPFEVYRAAVEFVRFAQAIVDSHSRVLPNVDQRCRTSLPKHSIESAELGGDDIGPFVATKFRSPKKRTARFLDPCYFVAVRLMEIAGCRFRFHNNSSEDDPNKHYYLRCQASHAAGRPQPFLLRIIEDTQPEEMTRQLPADHHDYRRIVLDRMPRQRGVNPRIGRPEAIKLSRDLLEAKPTLAAVTPDDYESLLRQAFAVADQVYTLQKGGVQD